MFLDQIEYGNEIIVEASKLQISILRIEFLNVESNRQLEHRKRNRVMEKNWLGLEIYTGNKQVLDRVFIIIVFNRIIPKGLTIRHQNLINPG